MAIYLSNIETARLQRKNIRGQNNSGHTRTALVRAPLVAVGANVVGSDFILCRLGIDNILCNVSIAHNAAIAFTNIRLGVMEIVGEETSVLVPDLFHNEIAALNLAANTPLVFSPSAVNVGKTVRELLRERLNALAPADVWRPTLAAFLSGSASKVALTLRVTNAVPAGVSFSIQHIASSISASMEKAVEA